VCAAPKLVLPYTSAILRALLAKLRATSSPAAAVAAAAGAAPGSALLAPAGPSSKAASTEDSFELAVLGTLGELAAVAGPQVQPAVPEMLPLIIDALGDASSPAKRLVAVRTLGRVVESTGAVVEPYLEYPQLLGMLLRMLGDGGAAARREVSRVLGIVGALDPHTHKVNLAELQGEGKLEREGVRPQYPGRAPDGGAGAPGTLMPGLDATVGGGGGGGGGGGNELLPSAGMATSSEDYYPTVAINALMRVLRDPALGSLHARAVAALFDVVGAMGLGFVPFLPKVVPVLLALTRAADDPQRRVEMVRALTELVVLMRQHVRKFLPDLLALVDAFWGSSPGMLPHVLTLLAELSRELISGRIACVLIAERGRAVRWLVVAWRGGARGRGGSTPL
jgi:FKBP12-rapamycin complex-associated protein